MTLCLLSWFSTRASSHVTVHSSPPSPERVPVSSEDCLTRKYVDCREFDHCANCTPVEQVLRIAQGLAGHPLMGDH